MGPFDVDLLASDVLFRVTLRVSRSRSFSGATARERRGLIYLLIMWRCTLPSGETSLPHCSPSPPVLVGPGVQHLANVELAPWSWCPVCRPIGFRCCVRPRYRPWWFFPWVRGVSPTDLARMVPFANGSVRTGRWLRASLLFAGYQSRFR